MYRNYWSSDDSICWKKIVVSSSDAEDPERLDSCGWRLPHFEVRSSSGIRCPMFPSDSVREDSLWRFFSSVGLPFGITFKWQRSLRKEFGEWELAQWHEGIEIRTARELLALRFREKASLVFFWQFLPVCIDSCSLPFSVWSILSVSILLCLFGVIISMFNDCRRLDGMHASSKLNGSR